MWNCNHAYDKILKEVLDKDQSFTKLSNDTVRTINDFTGTKIPLNEKGSVVNMCKAWRDQYDLAEKYAEADFNAVKSYERKEGIEIGIHKGENTLAETIKRLRNGESPEQIVASGIPQHTVDLAMTIR